MTASEPAYVDSSLLLEVLLGQPRAAEAARLWSAHERRVSSVLLEAECRTVLRRLDRGGALTSSLREAEQDLAEALDQVTLHNVDRSVVDRLGVLPELAACRTLDALHLATAALWRDRLGGIQVLTLDRAMAESARALGFCVAGHAG